MVDDLQPHVVALAIGLLIGLERERRHRTTARAVGVRTAALAALAGSVSARLGPAALAVVLAVLGAYALAAFVTSSTDDRGLTSEVALVVAGLLGALAFEDQGVAVALGVLVVVVLSEKERLHRVAGVITQTELSDALKFFVAAFVVLPLLPEQRFGPGGAVDPARIWRLVVLITAIGLVGYVAVRVLGPGRGLLVAGAAGGFVSASATTASMGRTARTEGLEAPALAAALLASVATLVQLVVVLAAASGTRLLGRVVPAAVAGSLVLAAEAWVLVHGEHADVPADGSEADGTGDRRAFALGPALAVAGLLTAVVVGVAWLREHVGTGAAVVGAALAGFADAQGPAAAAASLVDVGELSAGTALAASGAALATNTLTKVVLAFAAGGPRFGRRFTARLVLPSAAVAAALVLTG